MTDFFASYWLEVLLVIVSIFVGIVGSNLFHRFQKQDTAPTRGDRVKEAYEELYGLTEGLVVNKQDFTGESILNLMAAAERQYQVTLRDTYSPTSMLQDVLLSLQRSSHLDIAQKSKYAAQIEEKLSSFRQPKESPKETVVATPGTKRTTRRSK